MNRLYAVSVAVAMLAGGLLTAAVASGSELTWGTIATDQRILPRETMRVNMDILVDGRPARLIAHEGRLYLPVPRMGAEYEIRVSNRGMRRVAAVVSVDGLSVISGLPASERQPGYLIDPFGEIVIKGWRRDRYTVAAFTFEPRENSYAYRMGHRENIGVIGLVAFEELVARPMPMEHKESAPATAKRSDAISSTGTGWGRDIGSSIVYVPFVRSDNKQSITIYSDTEDALRRLGVPVEGRYPRPFPADPRYAPPPPALRER